MFQPECKTVCHRRYYDKSMLATNATRSENNDVNMQKTGANALKL